MAQIKESDYTTSGWIRWAITAFSTTAIMGILWVGMTLTQIKEHMQGFESTQKNVNDNQMEFNKRQLQFDELFKAEFQHVGHILSKIDTNAPRVRRK